MLSCIWVYDKEGFVRTPADSKKVPSKRRGVDIVEFSDRPRPNSRRGEVNIFQLIELDSTRISALDKGKLASSQTK